MRVLHISLAVFICAFGFSTPSLAQEPDIFSRTAQCKTVTSGPDSPYATCTVHALIIDYTNDKRISCNVSLTVRYREISRRNGLINHLVYKVVAIDVPLTSLCLTQVGLDDNVKAIQVDPIPPIVQVIQPIAYILYNNRDDKITFCLMGAGGTGTVWETGCALVTKREAFPP